MNEIEELRQDYLNILDVFGEVCRENGVKWYICAGTLLGAVRHSGFIPWDDDIDACCMAGDIPKLLAAKWPSGFEFGRFVNDQYILSMRGTTSICVDDGNWFSAVKNKPGICGVHLDVFPMSYVPDSANDAYRLHDRLRWASVNDWVKASPKTNSIMYTWKWFKKVFPAAAFGDGKQLNFEDRSYMAPDDPGKVLQILYGDYMTPNKGHRHRIFIDLNNDAETYRSGKLRLPSNGSFRHSEFGPMFADTVKNKDEQNASKV